MGLKATIGVKFDWTWDKSVLFEMNFKVGATLSQTITSIKKTMEI